jgi:hypothetical protein
MGTAPDRVGYALDAGGRLHDGGVTDNGDPDALQRLSVRSCAGGEHADRQ